LKIGDQEAGVVLAEVTKFLGRHVEKGARPFDLVYFDPPYAADYEAILNYAGQHTAVLFSEGGLMIVEHQKKRDLSDEFGALERYRVLKQGDSVLSFYRNLQQGV
jgi:16S rRNA G966 N2-methylase RsmD